jgi:hypothetical protein
MAVTSRLQWLSGLQAGADSELSEHTKYLRKVRGPFFLPRSKSDLPRRLLLLPQSVRLSSVDPEFKLIIGGFFFFFISRPQGQQRGKTFAAEECWYERWCVVLSVTL